MEAAARSVLSFHYTEAYEKMVQLEQRYRRDGDEGIHWKGQAMAHWSPQMYYENKYNRNLGVMLITIGFPDTARKLFEDEHEHLFSEKYQAKAKLRTEAMHQKMQMKRLQNEMKSLMWHHRRTMKLIKKSDESDEDQESLPTPGQEGERFLVFI